MRHLLYVFILSFVSISAQEILPIYCGLAPGTGARVDNEKIENDGNSITNVYQPGIRIFLPDKPDKNHAAVLICPGGGYNQIVIQKEGYRIAEWLNKNGIAAFVLKYRLNPMEALEDAQRAVSLLRFNADKYKINNDKIGVMGFSAGGHLAGNLATHFQKAHMNDIIDSVNCRPNFLILVYGAVDRLTSSINSDTPPTFLVHTGDDTRVSVQESINFYSTLQKNNISAELHIYEKGGHGFALTDDMGYVTSWADRCIDWMKGRGIIN